MKKLFVLVSAFFLLPSILAFAASKKTLSVQQIVDQYYQKTETREARHPQCPPYSDQSCFDAACDKMGSFGCDEMTEVTEVNKACRGNYDGTCLNSVCGRLGHFGCDEMTEIKTVTRACVGNYNMDCFESVCVRLGSFGCDEMKEVDEVLKTCSGN